MNRTQKEAANAAGGSMKLEGWHSSPRTGGGTRSWRCDHRHRTCEADVLEGGVVVDEAVDGNSARCGAAGRGLRNGGERKGIQQITIYSIMRCLVSLRRTA